MIFLYALCFIASVLGTFYFGTLLFDKATSPGCNRHQTALYTGLFVLFILFGTLLIIGSAGLIVMSLGSLWV